MQQIPASRGLTPNSKFGHYEILSPLGAGGMGEVYRARDSRLGRDVALKVLPSALASDSDRLERFEREARAASALNHPNIVTIYELGEVNATRYLAMELVTGQTLRQLLDQGKIPIQKIIHIASQVADGLAKAHDAGIVHRDLKPENIMVSEDGFVKILDFGLAKLIAPSSEDLSHMATMVGYHTRPGVVMGTVGYMSPEQVNGRTVDLRSDQFSFGVVLYEMATGQRAFLGSTEARTMLAILNDEPKPIASLNREVPAPLCWTIERCLAKDPDKRYPSTRELAQVLTSIRERLAELPLRRPEAHASNLPVRLTAFVGREEEIPVVQELLLRPDVLLATITGPAGVGKTRLALQVAEDLTSQFPGGAYFVPLATVSDPGLILPLIAQTVGVKDTGSSPADALKNYLSSLRSPMLLLLDNFEHLIAGAQSVAELLTLGANLKVLVTSREPLHVYGEYEFPVPPLALPDLKQLPPLEELSHYSAVALFKERAEAVNPNFELTEENASAVAEICERLDGLPLAIELAAARVKLLSPAAMHQRLSSRLQLLTGGAKERPARQQTLRGAIDWSYNLLNGAEQKLFSRLSVFVGGCTLEGVEAVCNTNGDLGLDPLDGMESMVDKSLVRRVEHVSGESRFAMLETIREYGLEKLAASNEEQLIRRAHAAYHLVLAEEAAEAPDAESGEWQERLKLELDNIRAALKWLVKTGNAEWGLRFGAALFRFWQTGEYFSEGRKSLDQLLKLGDPLPTKVRARALFAAGVLAGEQGDHEAAEPLLKESMNISQSLGDRHGQAASLNALAVHARHRGDIATARALLEESLKLWKEIGDQLAIARALSNLANFVKMQGDFEKARSLYEDSLSIFQELGDFSGVAWSLNYQGDVAREQGDPERAAKLYQQSLMTFRKLGDQWGIASALTDLGNLARDQSNFAEAESLYHKSLTMFHEQEQKRGIARVLECLACSAAAQSKAERSLRLAGAASALRQVVGAALSSDEQARLEKHLEPARKALSKGTKAWMEGWALPVDKAIKEALSAD